MPKRKETSILAKPTELEPKRQTKEAQPYDKEKDFFIEWEFVETTELIVNKRFNATEQWISFDVTHNFKSIPDLKEYRTSIDDAFDRAIRPFREGIESNDKMGFYIESPDLSYRIYLSPLAEKDFDKQRFLNQIFKTSQSNLNILNSGLLRVRVVIYKSLTGSGRGSKAPVSHLEAEKNKQSIIRIRNEDNSCGYRAIAMGMKYHEWEVKGNTRQASWRNLISRESAQTSLVEEFCRTYGLDSQTPVDNAILKTIDEKIDYQLIVIQNCLQMFVGTERPKVIYLLFDGQHYDLIKTMTGYLGKSLYCKYCNIGFSQAKFHRCKKSCFLCRSPFVCAPGIEQQCSDCKVTFHSAKCFTHHKVSKICKDRRYCPDCECIFTVETKHKHVCNEFHCKNCNEFYFTQPHYCFISPVDQEKITEEDKKLKIFIAYDIECMLEKTNSFFKHIPILLISHTFCDKCPLTGICDICGIKERVFYGGDCIERFVQYLLDFAKIAEKKKASITAFAHNNSGYDGHFLLRELMRRNIKGLDPTLNGTKIMKLDFGNIRLIDTLLLFQRPLADLPKMFGLSQCVKGFFPHYFNTPENQDLECVLSEISVEKFGREQMNLKRSADFDVWYSENQRMIYNLKDQMIAYCRLDVEILSEALISFRKLFIETTKVDPLSRCFTLASIGMEFFRAKLLPKGTIGITPIGGYNNFRKQSHSANAWLDLMEIEYKAEIVREYKIGKFFADGVIERKVFEDGNTYDKIAFEYNGCYFHRHSCKYENSDKMKEVEDRRQYYLDHDVWPVFVWECDWLSLAPPEYYQRYEYHKKVRDEGLYCDPRKALSGGRTNNLKFTHIASEDEEIKYLDFTSLYPYILSRRDFPGGHPKVFKRDFPDISDVFGFVTCKVLPPKNLYLPVLPYSTGGKLTFPLCRTCAEDRNNISCHHSANDRCLISTFVSVELQKALELGYKVIEVYEILHYEKRIDDLFQEYVNVWYKIKAEASGFPSNCQTSEQKNEYLKQFEAKEGITLENVELNSGLRSIAKLMLNSFWGKLAQRPDLPVTKIVRTYDEMWNIFNDEKLKVTGDVIIEDMMLITYKNKDIENARVGNTSVAVACFVTAYARLKLYEEMEKIENSFPGSVLYFDTDSIIFVNKTNKYCPKIGNFLGQMTDEVKGEYGLDARMVEFHSTGPKTYAFKVDTPSGPIFKYKAKGLTQTLESQQILNFHQLKEMATDKANDLPNKTTLVPQQQFRCSAQHIVSSLHLNKRFEVTSDKRRVIGNNTLPYGFVDEDVEEFAELMTF